jgi:hypothetical protein
MARVYVGMLLKVVLWPLFMWGCSGADPGFVVRGGVSRRGVWGPLLGPQRVEGRALVGGPGGRSPPEALGV